jgi:hypothetical protein
MTEKMIKELIDKQAIRDVQVLYAFAIDSGSFDKLDNVFTENAIGDYSRAGCVTGVKAIKALCREALGPLTSAQHLNASHMAEIDGNVAQARCYLHVHLHRENTPGGDHLEMGGIYDDELVRTDAGWRIKQRKLTILWSEGNPEVRW